MANPYIYGPRYVLLILLISVQVLTAQSPAPQNAARDQRAFWVELSHLDSQRYIRIHALFYSARNHPKEHAIIEAAANFWNGISGKFQYTLRLPSGTYHYPIYFDLQAADGAYNEYGFFIPTDAHAYHPLNHVEVIADSVMEKLLSRDNAKRIVGYAPNNAIYIAHSYAHSEHIAIHEAGHRIGAQHVHTGEDIMAAELHNLSKALSPQSLYSILHNVGISHRNHRQSEVYPHEISELGDAPLGFYEQGKIEKHKKRERLWRWP